MAGGRGSATGAGARWCGQARCRPRVCGTSTKQALLTDDAAARSPHTLRMQPTAYAMGPSTLALWVRPPALTHPEHARLVGAAGPQVEPGEPGQAGEVRGRQREHVAAERKAAAADNKLLQAPQLGDPVGDFGATPYPAGSKACGGALSPASPRSLDAGEGPGGFHNLLRQPRACSWSHAVSCHGGRAGGAAYQVHMC
jgi:hypothetical protein